MPPTFECMIDAAFRGLKWQFDIPISTTLWYIHQSSMSVFHNSTNSGLVFGPPICILTPRSALSELWKLKVLIHLVSSDAVQPDPANFGPLLIIHLPQAWKQYALSLAALRTSRIALLNPLLNFRILRFWGESAQKETFFLLKSALTSPPQLSISVERTYTEQRTDTSGCLRCFTGRVTNTKWNKAGDYICQS